MTAYGYEISAGLRALGEIRDQLKRATDRREESQELADISTALTDLTTAVRELADAVRTQPRRRWWSRRTLGERTAATNT